MWLATASRSASRRVAAAVEAGREQLLGEQRVALRAHPQALDQLAARRGAEDVRQLLGELIADQRAQLEAPRARVALELREQRAQRVPAVQLVGAVSADHQHPLVAQAARQEGE